MVVVCVVPLFHCVRLALPRQAAANRKLEDYINQKMVDLANLKATKLKKEGQTANAELTLR